MTTTLSLDAALSGLKAAQRQLDTISGNIANASTAGYTRKILPTETLIVGGTGMGVQLNAIVRSVDRTLLRDLVQQVSVSSGSTVTQTFLSRIQSFHGASEEEANIAARIGHLADAFALLSSAPDSVTQLNNTVTAAQQVAKTFNQYAALIGQMRNEAEGKIAAGVSVINTELEKILSLNNDIQALSSAGKSVADLEDQRDIALRNISQYMEVSTYLDGDGRLNVMTKQGQALVDSSVHALSFTSSNLIHTAYYPGGGANGLFVGGPGGIEVTQGQIGGELGALFDLRDNKLPTYLAQMDEMAQKLSYRLEQQGLRLFTDGMGNVPANVAPPGAVGYVGYSAEIRVNPRIVSDPTLLRNGTYGAIVAPGSNEVVRRVSEFAFGAFEYEVANGTVDISAGDLFTTLGMTQYNRINGNTDITDYVPDLDDAPNITLPATFNIDVGAGAVAVTINPGDAATDLVNSINTAVGSAVASLSGGGQLVITAGADITFTDVSLGAAGMADLGLTFTTYPASDPAFTVQVGSQNPVTISINSTDTSVELLAALNAIPNLTATLGTGGELVLTPQQGGDITLTDTIGTPLALMGVTVGGVAHTPFRTANLGPGADLSTGLLANGSIEDFARAAMTKQAQDAATAEDAALKEEAYLQSLDKRMSDESGVDLDQEVSELIRVQTAYAAAARMITATERLLDELLNAV